MAMRLEGRRRKLKTMTMRLEGRRRKGIFTNK